MKVEIRNVSSLSKSEMDLMNIWMKKEFGQKYVRKFKEYYPGDAKCFFIIEKKKIVAFMILNPVLAEYVGEKYKIFGMGDLVTVRRGEGYGRIMIESVIKYLKKSGKTGLGFCSRKNTPFYEKVGLKTKTDLMKRFRHQDPKTGRLTPIQNGDGVFYGGKDNFLDKILKTKHHIYLDTELW